MTKKLDFSISREDFYSTTVKLGLRGSGDLFGIKQSGDMCFSVANIKNDFNILVKAQQDSLEFLNNKEYLLEENINVKKIIESSINLD